MSGNNAPPRLERLGGRSVLFVIAARLEYGPMLQRRFLPLICGVGPVEAAVNTTAELARCAAEGTLPDLVVSLGSAGSSTLQQAAVYQVASVCYRDMDATLLGFEKGQTPFLAMPAIVELPVRIDGIPSATLSTGAGIVSGTDYQHAGAEMVDMETYAVLRACQAYGVPLIGLRGISDGASDLRQLDDWAEALPVIDARLADALDLLEAALADGLKF